MTPYEEAAAVYDREPCARSFREDLELHLLNGYVLSGPEFFVLARPVNSQDTVERMVDPAWVWPVEDCDAWWIYLFAGDLKQALGHFPFPMKWIGWERQNALRWYRWRTVERIPSLMAALGA